MKYSLKSIIIIVLTMILCTGNIFSQTVSDNLYVVDNGSTGVRAILQSGNTIYIGGNFSQVGPASGYGVVLDTTTGNYDSSFPKVLGAVFSRVEAVVPDGSGGWYIGGFFTSVGGLTRNNIAHIKSDKTVDASWDPNATGGVVYALAISGSTVYAGGDFTNIGGAARNRIAALDATTGAATAWNPNAGGTVNEICVSGSTVYAGGIFTTIGAATRNRIAALEVSTGNATTWDPNATSGQVNAIAVSGSTIYAGGTFTTIGGQTRNRIAALNASTGLATTWDPDASSTVSAIVVSGSLIYVGGIFSTIGGAGRPYLAALDASTGTATSWITNSNSAVSAIVKIGRTIYVGGSFTSLGATIKMRYEIASIDSATGEVFDWSPNANNSILALAASGSTIYAGGYLSSINGQARNKIAAIDATTGSVTSWNPNADGAVYALAIYGTTIYAGGAFSNIGGASRYFLAALDPSTGNATAWNPNPTNSGTDIRALCVSDPVIYAAGNFSSAGGELRTYIAAINLSTGAATTWNPSATITTNGIIYALAISGSNVYAGGVFTSIGGQTRNRIAAIDASTGNATAWDPNATSGQVNALAVSGSTIYAGGTFTTIAGQTRNRIAALDATTGSATTWNPNATTGTVNALAVSGSLVYAGGSFSTIGGQPRNRIAALDASTGSATSWNPNAQSDVNVLALDLTNARVYIGGAFTNINNSAHSAFAGLSNPDDSALPVELTIFTAHTNGSAVELQWNTAAEVNNYGFEIERRTVGHPEQVQSERSESKNGSVAQYDWFRLGFVEGSGTTNAPKEYSFNDRNIASGKYSYRLKQVDRDGDFGYSQEVEVTVGSTPKEFALEQNYPNPFNPSTFVQYALSFSSMVTLIVRDVLGREVAVLVNEKKDAGRYSVQWDASSFASGVYLCTLKADNYSSTKKIVLLR